MREGRREHWFETEVDHLLPALLGTALRLTRDQADAEDLVAEALAKAWCSLDSLRDRAAIRGWLTRIVTNTFISHTRSAASRAPTEPYQDEACDEEGFSIFERLHQPFLLWQANPEQNFLDRLLREDLARAIDSLPEAFRLVVVLVEVQGFSYQEVADTLDIPIGTVRSRLARGRSLLQKALWDHAIDAGLDEEAAQESRRGPDNVHP